MYAPNPVPENLDDIRRYLNDELQNIRNAISVESWMEVGATNAPAFENSWVNYGTYGSTWETAAFYKDPFGVVHIRGLVKSGTLNSTIFTLPEGYRPGAYAMFAVIQGTDTAARLDVNNEGSVKTFAASDVVYQSLNASFKV